VSETLLDATTPVKLRAVEAEDDEDARLRDKSVKDQGDQLIPRPLFEGLIRIELTVMAGPAG
jgi:hypothetical protein